MSLDDATVRPFADAHGAAVVAGDTAHVMADIDPALHAHMSPVLEAMPAKVVAAEVVSVEPGEAAVVLIRYSGEDSATTIRSVWKQVGDRPLIVEAAPAP